MGTGYFYTSPHLNYQTQYSICYNKDNLKSL